MISVLTIGGYAGYTTAMKRYHVYEIIDMASKYATISYTAYEANRAQHDGKIVGFVAPTFCSTKLAEVTSESNGEPVCKVNGAKIKTAFPSPTAVNLKIVFDLPETCSSATASLGKNARQTV